jgi:hypothetical protein
MTGIRGSRPRFADTNENGARRPRCKHDASDSPALFPGAAGPDEFGVRLQPALTDIICIAKDMTGYVRVDGDCGEAREWVPAAIENNDD